jgi:hypothetical protein
VRSVLRLPRWTCVPSNSTLSFRLQPGTLPDRVVVQWDKDNRADMSIIQVDLLGLGMMAVLKDSVSFISNHHRVHEDLAHRPENDSVVYKSRRRADNAGPPECRLDVIGLCRDAVIKQIGDRCGGS